MHLCQHHTRLPSAVLTRFKKVSGDLLSFVIGGSRDLRVTAAYPSCECIILYFPCESKILLTQGKLSLVPVSAKIQQQRGLYALIKRKH